MMNQIYAERKSNPYLACTSPSIAICLQTKKLLTMQVDENRPSISIEIKK